MSLRVLISVLRLCAAIDNQFVLSRPLDLWKQARFLITIRVHACVCGCEMSQYLLRRMTSLFLSLCKMRFDFLDVTVSIWGLASISYTLLACCFVYFSPLLSDVMNMKSEVACVAASSHSSTVIPKYKRHSPRLHRLIPLFTTCTSRADFSEPLLMMTTLSWESHLNGSRKSLLDYLTSSPIRLIWISNLGTCTKAPTEAALETHWAYYTCTTRSILGFFF